MTTSSLSEALWLEKGLQEAVRAITVSMASSDVSGITRTHPKDTDFDWFHLLRCASLFVAEQDEKFNEIGLRLIHGCLIGQTAENERAFAGALLAKIASNPSLKLAQRRHLIPENILQDLPTFLKIDVLAHQIAATINIDRPDEFVGNSFQTSLWNELQNKDWISASAPTSAGKSFVLQRWVERMVSEKTSSRTYFIVPTRALITQVETDLRNL